MENFMAYVHIHKLSLEYFFRSFYINTDISNVIFMKQPYEELSLNIFSINLGKNIIVTNPLSETTVFIKSSLFNDTGSLNHQGIYMKLQQVKQSGSRWRGREREKVSIRFTE